ncbi:Baseplate protein J-like [uncultured Caudovirales phage]|uniref:Baseplate protein J-like n=1 Tax=uncultured Caudovirales phage TaxID=2100421 RepID=A0A6J5L250_9CAUD|nr:Baseplate protein J-like [uncultured Caudovirales phage]
MSDTPTPRSFNQILGDSVGVFLSKFGLKKMKVGSPALSILEAAAMSDLRSSQDIFTLLRSSTLDNATGTALDRAGADEDAPRLTQGASSGTVTISDSRITKVSSRIYQGSPSPIVGSTSINIVDGSKFGNTGKLYLGRGTNNFEGPLEFISNTNNGSFWTIVLRSGVATQKFHDVNEGVILAQSGDRVIGAGTIPQTPQGNASTAVQFTTLYPATILDGEVSIEGVIVVCKSAGTIGNIPNGAISEFSSPPFPGAVVTNPLPFNNGTDAENDTDYRERIRNVKRSRSKGTDVAIITNVTGAVSPDENKRVASASIVKRNGQATALYIDDGTGYEDRSSGVALETLASFASGGEQFFTTSQTPLSQAFVESLDVAPFAMTDLSTLSARVGGTLFQHQFRSVDFKSIANATAYEVVASINANPLIQFQARTSNSGANVVLFAKTDTNEDIEVLGGGANDALRFPVGLAETIKLYKNDRLLSKDGKIASLVSQPTDLWQTLSGSETLDLKVDGISLATVTFNSQVFIDANTGFLTLGNNTPAAWAAVFNNTIPGITATVENNLIALKSNADRTAKAKLEIVGGTLVAKGMFVAGVSVGAVNDYTINRNTGNIQLNVPLSAGDVLTAGSANTRGFVESAPIAPVTLATDGVMYYGVDGGASILKTGIDSTVTFNITKPTTGVWGARYRIAATSGTPFHNVVRGDWLAIWDSASAWANLQGLWHIEDRGDTFIEIEYEDVSGIVASGVSFVDNGVALVRYNGQLENFAIPAAPNYTPNALASLLNAQTPDTTSLASRTNKLRIRTNTFDSTGDIAIVGVSPEVQPLLISPSDAVPNKNSQIASVMSSNAEFGTPEFLDNVSLGGPTPSRLFVSSTFGHDRGLVGLKNMAITTGVDRFGNNRNAKSFLSTGGGSPLNLRVPASQNWLFDDRFYLAAPYAISANDDLVTLIDNDEASKRFSVGLSRVIKPTTGTYGTNNIFNDLGDGTQSPVSLTTTFGTSFSFGDFAVYMKARAKSHGADANKGILWRYKRFGSEGNNVKIAYTYPAAPSLPVAVNTSTLPVAHPERVAVSIALPSDVKKTGYPVRNTTAVGYGFFTGSSPLPMVTLAIGFPVASATRTSTTVVLSLTLPNGAYAVTDHGMAVGRFFWLQSTDPTNFPTGLKQITAVTTTSVSYTEAGAATTTANVGTLSMDTVGEATFSGAIPSVIAVGDLVHVGVGPSIPSNRQNETIRITNIGPQFIQGFSENSLGSSNQALTVQDLNNAALVTFYSIKASSATATAIAAAVTAVGTKSPVVPTLISSGSGSIVLSSRDELLTPDAGFQLTDGINWVSQQVNPTSPSGNYTLSFKGAISGDLVSNSDWANEQLKLVPITAANIVSFLSVPSITGLSISASVDRASQGHKVQLSSKTIGSDGATQVQGGTANSTTAAVVGTAIASGGFSVATVNVADVDGLQGNQWVSIDNTNPSLKTGLITSTTSLQTWDTAGHIALVNTSTPVFTLLDTLASITVQVEKQGRYVAVVGSGTTNANEGDWVVFSSAGVAPMSSTNQVIRRIVRITANTVWIENDSATEESLKTCKVQFFSANSLMPGDTLSISSDAWGVDKKGSWTVLFIGDSISNIPFSDAFQFRVDMTGRTITPVVAPIAALGMTEAQKILVTNAQPTRLLKRIQNIAPNQSDTSLVDVKFDTAQLSADISSTRGSVIAVLDKLAFDTGVYVGADGYKYGIGLIGEVAKIVYGDPRDTSTYPGVAASGDVINISGPAIKRVQVSIAVRIRLGIPFDDIKSQVKASVASVVNQAGVGESISLSDIVGAVNKVNGVQSVAIVSPAYNVGNDLISVQPFEKPLVLDLDQDIVVSSISD